MEFMKSLKGESALQRFYQWRKQFDECTKNPKIAKKVTHCSVCCHPGSAKEHERKGCEFCASERYCQPHDYDYICPCEWHKAEQEKKSNPLEYTFKMKAKKREGFPYHEVIQEFLVNKDKLVKVIKWVRPSLSSFQKYALDRMEWPRHYSCEKLMVLLAYYDMHERKAGRIRDAQLQAVRIIKTRVRNGVPCYEIEWVKPDDYVFPDDHPAEGPLLTIEEESLFKEAYPNIVELFLKEKEESELLKLKCKKSKPKSKVLPDVDDVASLLSGMSLTSALERPPSPPDSNTKSLGRVEPSVGIQHVDRTSHSIDFSPTFSVDPSEINFIISATDLDTEDGGEKLPDKCSSPIQVKPEQTVSSPNVSSLISELQLSSIDWEGTSFSNSPSLETRTTCKHLGDQPTADEPLSANFSDHRKDVVGHNKESVGNIPEQLPSVSLESPYSSHVQKLPLRERILIKNASHSVASHSQRLKETHLPLKPQPTSLDKRQPIKANSTQVKENVPPSAHSNVSKLQGAQSIQKKKDEVPKTSEEPATRSYTFVKKTTLVPCRTVSHGSISNTTSAPKATVKKSVCRRVTLSSDDEEAVEDTLTKYGEEQQSTEVPVKAKSPDLLVTPPLRDGDDGSGVDDDNVFLSPKAPRTVSARSSEEESDGDDSLVSVDSPLPLSERLKLRSLQKC